MTDGCEGRQTAPGRDIDRRAALRLALGAGLALCASCPAAAQTADPRTQRPRPDDRFVRAGGERGGQAVVLDDVRAGGPPLMVYPVDPASGVVRDGSRLNQVLLVRLAPDELDEPSRARSADGVVAYSGVCTHAGCDVTLWQAEIRRFRCPCHESEFDPRDHGRVVGGPAPRRLPQLPVKLVEGVIVASGGFTSRPGFQPG
jgi:rieske iron-sulfur protein